VIIGPLGLGNYFFKVSAGFATAAAIWIFPVATRRAAQIAERACLGSLADLVEGASDHLRRQPGEVPLSSASRAVDHAHQQFLTTARPLGRHPRCRAQFERKGRLYAQTAHHARNLVADVTRENTLALAVAGQLATAAGVEGSVATPSWGDPFS
jgi:hypothetical protein